MIFVCALRSASEEGASRRLHCACRGQTSPKALLIVVGAIVLMVAMLAMFQRKLSVAFNETKQPAVASATNQTVVATNTAVSGGSDPLHAGASAPPGEGDREKALELFTRGTDLIAAGK